MTTPRRIRITEHRVVKGPEGGFGCVEPPLNIPPCYRHGVSPLEFVVWEVSGLAPLVEVSSSHDRLL